MAQVAGEVAVELGEGFEVALGVAAGRAGRRRRDGRQRRHAAGQALGGLTGRVPGQRIGRFLVPVQRGLGAVDAQAQVVFLARRDLAGPEQAARAVGVAQLHLHMVIDAPAGHEGGQLGADPLWHEAGDELGELRRVRADVAEAACRAGQRGVGAPRGLLLAGGFERLGEPVLRIFDLHDAHVAQLTRLDQRPRGADQRIAAVVVR